MSINNVLHGVPVFASWPCIVAVEAANLIFHLEYSNENRPQEVQRGPSKTCIFWLIEETFWGQFSWPNSSATLAS